MRNILIFFILAFTLSACSYFHVHRMDVEQGNILTPELVNRIHTGMTKQQVINILGEPLLTNVFSSKYLDYVYTYRPGYGPETQKYITLRFRGNILTDIKGNLYSAHIRQAAGHAT